jgi:hypothetical protein
MCAGQGRDVIDVLADYARRDDVEALLVELDPRNVEIARRSADDAGLARVRVREADASLSDSYAGAVPADVVLECGVFGNISEDDIRRTVEFTPKLCAPCATVIWTRGERAGGETVARIRGWYAGAGFEEIALEAPADATFRVGVHRLAAPPQPFEPGVRLFRFMRGEMMGA